MNPMNFLLGVMGSGSVAFVGLSAYAVVEARQQARQLPHAPRTANTVKPVQAPIEVLAAPETPAVATVVVPEPIPIVEEAAVPAEEPAPTPAAATPALVLGYWPIRGLAGSLRMLLEYSGAVYEDRHHDADSWFGQTKPELAKSNALANLPYLTEGDRCIAQSNALLLYLGVKLGLDPDSLLDPKAVTNMQVLNESIDVRRSLVAIAYPGLRVSRTQEEYEANRVEQLTQRLPQAYAKLEGHLSQTGTPFFSADTPLSADFHLWETLDHHEALARVAGVESPLMAFPKLQAFYGTFRQLPQLENYFASETSRLPINGDKAYFR
eukprot:EG_transcript_16850